MAHKLRLGVNIDHVATLRNARDGSHPDSLRAALVAKEAGADGITAHLREDRRHIRDADMDKLKSVGLPLNFEMAATEEMLAIALRVKPHACCLVPEKRQEKTTEGGLNVVAQENVLKEYSVKLAQAGIKLSLFIDPDKKQIDAAKRIGAPIVELHTGTYAHRSDKKELTLIQEAAAYAASKGIEPHAGHGLDYDNVGAIAAIPELHELNIGHFLVGEAVFVGLAQAIKEMRKRMDEARK